MQDRVKAPSEAAGGDVAPQQAPATSTDTNLAFSSAGPLPAVQSVDEPPRATEVPSASQLAYGEDQMAAEASAPSGATSVRVKASHLRVRTSPSTKSSQNIVGGLARNTEIAVTGHESDWMQISYKGAPAFIHGAHVEAIAGPATPAKEPHGAEAQGRQDAAPQVASTAPRPDGPELAQESKAKENDGDKDTEAKGTDTQDGDESATSMPVRNTAQATAPTVAATPAGPKTFTTLKGTTLEATTKEEAVVLNEIRLQDKRFDPAWLLAAQKALGVQDQTGAFNTETLRKMRDRKKDQAAGSAELLDTAFLNGIHKDADSNPFVDDDDLKTSTHKRAAVAGRGTGADRAAQAVGYRDFAAYKDDWEEISFLGKALPGKGHPYLASRLQIAETFLRQMNPGLEGKALRDAVGWSGAGNASYDASDADVAAGKTHLHTMGLAIDIDKEQNPWMLGRTINDQDAQNKWWIYDYWQPVFEVAAKVYGGDSISITSLNEWSDQLSTEELHAKVSSSSASFMQLLALARTNNERGILSTLEGPADAQKYSATEAKRVYDAYVSKLPGYWVNRFGRTAETKSFTNHSQQMLVALRDVAGLAWGGSELADRENGDFMHFDCRGTSFGQSVYDAGRRNRGIRQ